MTYILVSHCIQQKIFKCTTFYLKMMTLKTGPERPLMIADAFRWHLPWRTTPFTWKTIKRNKTPTFCRLRRFSTALRSKGTFLKSKHRLPPCTRFNKVQIILCWILLSTLTRLFNTAVWFCNQISCSCILRSCFVVRIYYLQGVSCFLIYKIIYMFRKGSAINLNK